MLSCCHLLLSYLSCYTFPFFHISMPRSRPLSVLRHSVLGRPSLLSQHVLSYLNWKDIQRIVQCVWTLVLLKNLYMELTGPEFTWKGMNVFSFSAGMASRDRGWDLLLRILQWGDVVGVHDSTFGNKEWKSFPVYFHTHTLKLELFNHFRAHLFQCSINPEATSVHIPVSSQFQIFLHSLGELV